MGSIGLVTAGGSGAVSADDWPAHAASVLRADLFHTLACEPGLRLPARVVRAHTPLCANGRRRTAGGHCTYCPVCHSRSALSGNRADDRSGGFPLRNTRRLPSSPEYSPDPVYSAAGAVAADQAFFLRIQATPADAPNAIMARVAGPEFVFPGGTGVTGGVSTEAAAGF